MKKLIIGFLAGLILGTFITAGFSNSNYQEYSDGTWPEQKDLIRAEINQAKALRQISEEGLTLNIVFKNKLEVNNKNNQ